MGADPLFHCTESIRREMRDTSLLVFATDSITSPEKSASRGMTMPSTRVAIWSFAWILVPAGVLPAITLCCRITGNSCTPEGAATAGFCWPANMPEQPTKSTKVDTTVVLVLILIDIEIPLLSYWTSLISRLAHLPTGSARIAPPDYTPGWPRRRPTLMSQKCQNLATISILFLTTVIGGM